MTKVTARYVVTYGLSGCYMPNNTYGPIEFVTRKELANFIRYELAFYGMPASLFRDVGIRNRWSFISKYGSSVAHFHLDYKGYRLSFHGLTEEEFYQQCADGCV